MDMKSQVSEQTMANVRCEPERAKARVAAGVNLLDAIHQAGLPISQACDGTALCGFCRVHVLKGGDNLSPMGVMEQRVLASFHAAADERLACCATVHGEVTITTDYWD
jgi:adenylate cyclase